MACLGLVTLRPLRPERSLPCFMAFISRSTDFEAPGLYFLPDFLTDLRAVFVAVARAAFLADFFAGFLAAFRGDFAEVFLDGAIVVPLQLGSNRGGGGCALLGKETHEERSTAQASRAY
jgi:hypothetical protein